MCVLSEVRACGKKMFGSDGPVAPARGQQVKKVGSRMNAVTDDFLSSAEAAICVNVLRGRGGGSQ